MDDLTILREWIIKNDEKVFNTEIEYRSLNEGIALETLEDFEKAYEKAGAKLLFSHSLFLSSEMYVINPVSDVIMIDEVKDEINKRITKYNKELRNKDFFSPMIVYVYFVYEGQIVSYVARSKVFINLENQEVVLEKIKTEVSEIYDEEKIRKIKLDFNRKSEQELKPITEMILADKGFHSCRNHGLRMKYISQLLVEHPDFRDKIKNAGYFKPSMYADDVWRMYKESLK